MNKPSIKELISSTISIAGGIIVGKAVTDMTDNIAIGVAAGTATTIVVAEKISTDRIVNDSIKEIETKGGVVDYVHAPIFGGIEIHYHNR